MFAPEDRAAAEAALLAWSADSERLRFAALRLSDGDLGALDKAIALGMTDWRDLLTAAGFAEDTLAHEHWIPSPRPKALRIEGEPDDEVSNLSWRDALALYDRLVGPQWHHIRPFRKLVAMIGHSAEASGLTAITSHETLTISPYTRYPDWFEGRHVRVHPLSNGRIRIDKYPHRFDRQPVETWTVSLEEAHDRILRLIADL